METVHTKRRRPGSAIAGGIPDDERVKALAERLEAIHGAVVIRRERSGVHLYMASPVALEEDGDKELASRHLAVNADKVLRMGRWSGAYDDPRPAQCMKYGKTYSIEELLGMPTLEERGIKKSRRGVTVSSQDRYLVDDGRGNMVPDGPGETVPILSLSDDHPAIEYLRWRGYEPSRLAEQFNLTFCVQEAPPGEKYRRWYRKHLAGWYTTPQGRIIFEFPMMGVRQGWQGRYLEIREDNGDLRVWHPYREQWEWVERGGRRTPLYEGEKWPPMKYFTAPGSLRSTYLGGFDNAVANAKVLPGPPTCVLTEGPLDAARFPLNGIPLLGKYLGEIHAALIAAWFRRAVLAFDIDESGSKLTDDAAAVLREKGVAVVFLDLSGVEKDVGELPYEEANRRYAEALEKF